jgi:integrase
LGRGWSNHAQHKNVRLAPRFQTKAQAETKADQLRTLRRNEGASALSLSAADRIDAEAALSLLAPHHRSLREAAEFFVKHLGIVQSVKTVSELVGELVANKMRDGASARYVRDLRSRLNIFAASFPETNVTDLSTAAVDDWLRNLPHSGTTRNDYRRLVSVLFRYGIRRGYCLENPAQKASRARVVDKPPGILTPEQCVRLLQGADYEILPAITPGLFAGLSPESEVWRLDWRDVDLEAGLIHIEAAKTKSTRHRLVEMSENLKLWLLRYRKSSGPVSPSGDRYNYLLQSARKSAKEAAIKGEKSEQGIAKWPADALRHCYGSYHYAKFQNPGKTIVQMGHSNPGTFHAHYRARVTPADADKYWQIRPSQPRID